MDDQLGQPNKDYQLTVGACKDSDNSGRKRQKSEDLPTTSNISLSQREQSADDAKHVGFEKEKLVKVTADNIEQAGLSGRKRQKTEDLDESIAMHSFGTSKQELSKTLKICETWLEVIVDISEEKEKYLMIEKGYCYIKKDIKKKKLEIYEKTLGILLSDSSCLNNIGIFTRLFLLLPEMRSPTQNTLQLNYSILPDIPRFIIDLWSSSSFDCDASLKELFQCLGNNILRSEEKLNIIVLLIPFIHLCSFSFRRKGPGCLLVKENSSSNANTKSSLRFHIRRCKQLLNKKNMPTTDAKLEAQIANTFVELHVQLTTYEKPFKNYIDRTIEDIKSLLQDAKLSKNRESVKEVILFQWLVSYCKYFQFGYKTYKSPIRIRFEQIKREFEISEHSPITFNILDQKRQSLHGT